MRSGSSPRSLSPITDIWRPTSPVECRWLSVPRRYVGRHGHCALPCGPAAEPADGVTTAGVSGETSQPGDQPPAGGWSSDPDWKHLRMKSSSPLAEGRHRSFRITVVGLPPRVLSLIPQVTLSSQADDSFRNLPLFGPYCASVVIAGLPAPPWRGAHSARILSVFTFRLRHRIVSAADLLSKSAGG